MTAADRIEDYFPAVRAAAWRAARHAYNRWHVADDYFAVACAALARRWAAYDPALGGRAAWVARWSRWAISDARRAGRADASPLIRVPRTARVAPPPRAWGVVQDVPGRDAEPGTADDPAEAFLAALRREVGRLAPLSARDERVMAEYYVRGRTAAEIAAALGLTESAVCHVVRRVHGRCRTGEVPRRAGGSRHAPAGDVAGFRRAYAEAARRGLTYGERTALVRRFSLSAGTAARAIAALSPTTTTTEGA